MSVVEATPQVVNLSYQMIKLAWNHYQAAPETLDAPVREKIEQQAKLAQTIMTKVLGSEEAKQEQVKPEEVEFLFEQLKEQFDSEESFQLSLQEQALTEEGLKQAIYHDLVCEKTLQAQSLGFPEVTEQEALSYYDKNRERFQQPERREVSHILITINEELEGNERDKAQVKIEKIANRLKHHSAEFPNLALQHSECPTSLNNGYIGNVSRGQLYPELDAVLFNMKSNRVSSIVESEIGFHLLYCHGMTEAGEMEKQVALKEIRTQLNEHRKKKREKQWVSQLMASA